MDTQKRTFSGGCDFPEFFFYCENVAMFGKDDSDMATELLDYLEFPYFYLYFEKFGENGELSAAALDYGHAKRTTLDAFDTVDDL